ncbi:hypothetical protein, partial [Geobacillus stearothermophilus]|uniref:hypothetical protein n=1 Tax=Geobacillus stearothermophilus TaxID=1422 RepID=UPI003D1DC75B
VRRHLSSVTGKAGQWVVHPVDSNTFLYRVQATIKYNVLLNCLRLFFIMGRKGGFSSLGGGQTIAHGSFLSGSMGCIQFEKMDGCPSCQGTADHVS